MSGARAVICGAAVAMLGAGTMVSGAGAAKRPLCGKAKGRTLASSPALRVFETSGPGSLGELHTAWGCRKGSRTIRRLGSVEWTETAGSDFNGAKIAGGRYAVVVSFVELDESDEYDQTATVYDVRTGKRRGHIAVSGTLVVKPIHGFGLTPEGGVAVLDRGESSSRVIVNDAAGRRTVATSASIAGFGVTGATVSWTQDGQPKTTTLHGAAK